MRHRKLNKRLGRNRSQRKQLIRSLARALFVSYRIQTTLDKAKEVRKLADRIVTYAKAGELKDIRAIERILQDRALVSKILKQVSPLAKERKGGYARILKSGFRKGDGASLAVLELTDMPVIEKKAKKPKKQKQALQAGETAGTKQVKEQAKEGVEPKKTAKEEKDRGIKTVKEKKLKQEAKKPVEKETVKGKPDEAKKIEPAKEEKAKKEQGKSKGLFGRFKRLFKKDK